MPHLAIDVRMARDSGIGTYIRNVVPRVIATRPGWQFTLLGPARELRQLDWTASPNVRVQDCRSGTYSVAEQFELVAKVPRGADLFWSPHFNIPLLYRGRLLVTVHDVAHLALPEVVRGVAKRGYAHLMFRSVLRRAAAIICDSDFTRRELARLAGRGRSEPRVIHLGVAPEWWAEPRGDLRTAPGARPYVVAVGNVKPHKNLGTLLRAFESIHDRVPHDLVIAGRNDGMRTVDDEVMRAAQALGGRVRFTGELTDAALRALVAAADVLVMPSLYEGFGLPPLEAMAAGCPTLVSNAASLPEVCGEAAMYCDPRDAAAMATGLERLLCDAALRDEFRVRGRAHAAQFTWERCAARTLDAIEAAMSPALRGAAVPGA